MQRKDYFKIIKLNVYKLFEVSALHLRFHVLQYTWHGNLPTNTPNILIKMNIGIVPTNIRYLKYLYQNKTCLCRLSIVF